MSKELKYFIKTSVTGLDAIKRAPIVEYNTRIKCLRIGDISQTNSYDNWGYCEVNKTNYEKFHIEKNDIFIARTGASIGCSFIATKNYDSVFNNGLIRVRVNENALPQYIYYLLKTNNFLSFIIATGMSSATQPNIRINDLLKYSVNKVHSLTEQQHIVNTIGTVDNLIEKTNQKIILFEKLLKYIYQIYFNDKSSVNKLGDVIKYFVGGTFKSKDYTNLSSWKLITIKNIGDSGFNLDNITYFSMKPEYEKFKLEIGDILLTMTGYVGRTGIVDSEDCYLNQRIIKITCESKALIYTYLLMDKENISSLGHGSAQPNLSISDFLNIKVPFGENEVNYFKKYDYIFDAILKNRMNIRKLTNLKKLLLSKYF
ncbi:restriction endonuclease subunit S [Mycoplasma sp. 1232]|uniref:restriction endonuclease subunit S n=1 Tax=Mycoplasma sp. 1232 TaxID=3108527 RepID=UPI002B25962D|nr:restriction endonuclease subunit S [Mycoplasma sp. 1232]MEA4333851.1 restriction endonuclease subunit S [Mycoplasma sp. 1232]